MKSRYEGVADSAAAKPTASIARLPMKQHRPTASTRSAERIWRAAAASSDAWLRNGALGDSVIDAPQLAARRRNLRPLRCRQLIRIRTVSGRLQTKDNARAVCAATRVHPMEQRPLGPG